MHTFQNIRFPKRVFDELSTEYEIVTVNEAVTYNDGSSEHHTFCPVMQGNNIRWHPWDLTIAWQQTIQWTDLSLSCIEQL